VLGSGLREHGSRRSQVKADALVLECDKPVLTQAVSPGTVTAHITAHSRSLSTWALASNESSESDVFMANPQPPHDVSGRVARYISDAKDVS